MAKRGVTDRVKVIGEHRSGFGSWLRTKASQFVIAVLSLTSREGWQTETSHSGEPVTTESLLSLSTAWSCVNLWCGVVATLDCEVWRTDPRTKRPVRALEHPLQAILDGPNLDQTDVDFWEFVTASLEMRGNAYAEKGRVGGRLVALYPLRPDLMEVKRVRETGRLRYRFPGEDGFVRELDQDDVWHMRGPGGSPLGGLSTIAFGRNSFGLALAIDKAAGTTFKNGVRPSGILKFKDWLKADKREAAHAKLVREHTEAMNAGKPLVLEGGAEWQQISFSPEDAQMLESRAFSVEDICRWFQIPPILVGHSAKVSAWGTGIAQIIQGFVKFGLRRRLKRIEKSARQQLFTAQERGEGYFIRFNMDELMRGDPDARSKFYQAMVRLGVMTINEVRALEGFEPLEGGDEPLLQSQNVTLSSLLKPKPPPAPKPPPMLPAPSPKAVQILVTGGADGPRLLEGKAEPRGVVKRVTKRDGAGNILEWTERPLD